ncbi:MAG: ABC transporter permease [Ignavibacteriaceae bacterium]|nr:ABC transporter permease [Ignavibacteriaceae bacterium]
MFLFICLKGKSDMNIKRVKAIAKKELKHVLRDKVLLLLLLIFPAFLISFFGYAINFDVQNIKLSVYDADKSSLSREFTEGLTASEYFDLSVYMLSSEEADSVLEHKEAAAAIVIPEGFNADIRNGKNTGVQILIDGVDANTANIIKNYLEGYVNVFNTQAMKDITALKGIELKVPLNYSPVFWYNPDLSTTYFLVPGLISMILLITGVISVSLTFVKEKEKSTIDQINVSPVTNGELITGKILPYIALSLIDAVIVVVLGYILFDAVVQGSYLQLFLSTLVFLMSCISLGLFVSVIADSQQVAFTVGTFITLLPSFILSGFIFQIESMPKFIQIITNITPAKFYNVILRAIYIRGVGWENFWPQIVYLLIFSGIFLFLSVKITQKKRAL